MPPVELAAVHAHVHHGRDHARRVHPRRPRRVRHLKELSRTASASAAGDQVTEPLGAADPGSMHERGQAQQVGAVPQPGRAQPGGVQPGQPAPAVQRAGQRVGQVPAARIGPAGEQGVPGEPRCRQQRVVLAGQLLEQAIQASEVAPPVGAQRRLQLGRVPPSRDDVRVGVFRMPAWAEQVVDQPFDTLAARSANLPDNCRMRLRISSAAWSSRSARRRLSAAYGSRSPERCPVAFNLATA